MMHSVWARIAPVVRKLKSFRGQAVGRQQELELDVQDVNQLRKSIVGKPLRYNHDDSTLIGRVGAERCNADDSWDVRMDLSGETIEGRECIKYVKEGKLTGVSLKHVSVINEPLEVSLCVRGARGPESCIVAASNECTGMDTYDSNTHIYTLAYSRVIAASDEAEPINLTVMSLTAEPVAIAVEEPVVEPAAAAVVSEVDEPLLLPTLEHAKLILQSSNSILSRAQKDELTGKVADLEMARIDAEDANKVLMEELVALRASAAASQKAVVSATEDFNQRVNEDFARAFTAKEDESEMKAVMATLTPQQQALFAKVAGNVQKAATNTKTVSLNEAVDKRLDQWKASRNAKRKMPSTDAHQAQPARPAQVSASFGSWARSEAPEETRQPEPPQRREMLAFGVPLAHLPVEMAIIAASNDGYAGMRENEAAERERKMAPFDPGAGANFPHTFLTLDQRNLFLTAPRNGASNDLYIMRERVSQECHQARAHFKQPRITVDEMMNMR
jgi:hypothetical protein